jgi:hypothetical protein
MKTFKEFIVEKHFLYGAAAAIPVVVGYHMHNTKNIDTSVPQNYHDVVKQSNNYQKPSVDDVEKNYQQIKKKMFDTKNTPAPAQQEGHHWSEPGIKRVYAGIVSAEHEVRLNPNDNRFAYNEKLSGRTVGGKGSSSAYGPAQLTRNTLADHYKRRPEYFEGLEDHVEKMVNQGSKFLKAKNNDPTYGLGKKGELSGEEHHDKYHAVTDAVLRSMAEDLRVQDTVKKKKDKNVEVFDLNNPEHHSRLLQRWRGVDLNKDTRYHNAAQEYWKNYDRQNEQTD